MLALVRQRCVAVHQMASSSEKPEIRVDVLRQLAEQGMRDAEFRAVARGDLQAALDQFGYHLNDAEMALVVAFRDSLADAGIDLDLVSEFNEEQLLGLLGKQL